MNNRSIITVLSLIALLGVSGDVWGMRRSGEPSNASEQGQSIQIKFPVASTSGSSYEHVYHGPSLDDAEKANVGNVLRQGANLAKMQDKQQKFVGAVGADMGPVGSKAAYDKWKEDNEKILRFFSTIPKPVEQDRSRRGSPFSNSDRRMPQKVSIMAGGGLLLTGIIGSVLYATGAIGADKDGIKFKDSDAKIVQQVADMLKYDTTLPTNDTLDAAIDNSTLDPLIVTISQNQLFGRTLTSDEMTECSQLINRQQKSSEMLSQLLDSLGKQDKQLSVQDKATIKKLELLHNDNQKSFYLKELYIRYNIDRAAIDEDLSPRYQAIKDKLSALLDDASKQSTLALEDQSLSDEYKAFLIAQTNNLQSEITYVEDRRQVEEQATAMLKVINNLQDKTAEEKAANFMSQYSPLVQALDSTLMSDQQFSMRNEAEPYESSRNRTVAIFEGKAQPVSFMFQEPIMPAADQSAADQGQPEMIMMPVSN